MAIAELSRIQELLERARRGAIVDERKRVRFEDPSSEEALEELKEVVISMLIGEAEIEEASRWIASLTSELFRAVSSLGGSGWTMPKEMKSFVKDPRAHLRKKLFLYSFDLLRGKIELERFLTKARAALTTSLRTNMRAVYQSWVLASILSRLGELGGRLVYPEHGYVPLDRSGRQRAGSIPSNAVVRIGRGELSIFVEAPRPVGWEDTRDLRSVWRLYVMLRPDMLFYSGRVLDIARLDGEGLPVLRPDAVVECKELSDWYLRSRELRGPSTRPLSAEEWMTKWLEGLWVGLSDALGVSEEEAAEIAKKSRGVRVSEVELVKLYARLYSPRRFFLVSRPVLPSEARRELESEGIEVVEGVEVGRRRELEELAEELAELASPAGLRDPLSDLADLLASRGVRVERRALEEALAELAERRLAELLEILRARESAS
ncbi:MAG: hypothetical protein QXU97_04180 [Fervidicoccaceae archaeon]